MCSYGSKKQSVTKECAHYECHKEFEQVRTSMLYCSTYCSMKNNRITKMMNRKRLKGKEVKKIDERFLTRGKIRYEGLSMCGGK